MDRVVLEMGAEERASLERRAREHALSFDRVRVFDTLFPPRPLTNGRPAAAVTSR
jgi:hypothetical protein